LAEQPGSTWGTALEDLGLPPKEAAVLTSLARGPADAQELAAELGVESSAIVPVLRSLTSSGLVKRLPGKTARFDISSPDVTLRSLARSALTRIERAQMAIEELIQERGRREVEPETGAEYLEVVTGIEAIGTQMYELQAGAQEEVVGCTKAPLLLTVESGNPGEREALDRGVSNRWLWERQILEDPEMLEDARSWAAAGEEVRVIESLPCKFFIFDRTICLMHVTEAGPSGTTLAALVTRHPELVSTLLLLFEYMWSTAAPLVRWRPEDVKDEGGKERALLVDALVAGLKDATIARQLDVSPRTLARRLSELFEELNAANRFQAGFLLAETISRGGGLPAPIGGTAREGAPPDPTS
jgi:sugar-specific transcriptional regulator TrmB